MVQKSKGFQTTHQETNASLDIILTAVTDISGQKCPMAAASNQPSDLLKSFTMNDFDTPPEPRLRLSWIVVSVLG